jgi:hypothetical protein
MGTFEKDGYRFYDGFFNEPVLEIDGYNIDDKISYIKENSIKNVSLDKSLVDFSFLNQIDCVEEIYISANIVPAELYKLKKLRRIVTNITNNKPNINYSKFIHLEYLSIDWHIDFPDLSNNKNLKEVVIWKYKPKNKSLSELKLPQGIEKIKITESNIEDLEGFKSKQLKTFEAYHCRTLRSLIGLKDFADNLEELTLDYCKKIVDYESLEYGKNLKKIILGDCGDLPNLNWLRNLKNVKHFSFYNTKLLDGDVSPCFGIQYVSFRNSKNYNYKIEDFRKKNVQ